MVTKDRDAKNTFAAEIMKQKLYTLFALILASSTTFAQSFEEKTTTASGVRLNVTNLGTFGNAFRGYRDGSGDPSCEYPAGSGVEHLFEAGFWFGGQVNGQSFVSTSAVDAPQGYATGRAGFEYTASEGAELEERSSLFDSPFYSADAISHQDYIARFTDGNILVPGTQIPIQSHDQPLFVDVTMETYNWNYTFSDFFVIANFKIVNNGAELIDSAHFALWANTVIRNINITPAGSGGSAFYNKGANGYSDSLHMGYCYDHSGDVGFTDTYIGQKFLGAEDKFGFHHPDIDSAYNEQTGNFYTDNFDAFYNTWQFNSTADPVYFQPANDQQRYELKMTDGLNKSPCWTEDLSTNPNCPVDNFQTQLNQAGNRSDLVSVGPFRDFQPGDTIEVSYAFVLGRRKEDGNPQTANTLEQKEIFFANADWAQTAYNGEDVNFNGILDDDEDTDGSGEITRFILPTPPNTPRTRIEAQNGQIDIYWSDNSEESIDPITQTKDFEGYRVYLSKLGFDVVQTPPQLEYVAIAQYDIANNDVAFETGFDSIELDQPIFFEGDTTAYHYKYTIDKVLNGWQYAVAVTAFDRGNPESNLESLESAPSANDFRVFPGLTTNNSMEENEPFVYPNPYYAGAAWEGRSNFQEESRKINFSNLPERCVIRVFTVAGDLIDEIKHDQQYTGTDIRWFETFGAEDSGENRFSGGEHSWDLLSSQNQIIGRGLYLFTVEDLDSGELFKGKFLIIK